MTDLGNNLIDQLAKMEQNIAVDKMLKEAAREERRQSARQKKQQRQQRTPKKSHRRPPTQPTTILQTPQPAVPSPSAQPPEVAPPIAKPARTGRLVGKRHPKSGATAVAAPQRPTPNHLPDLPAAIAVTPPTMPATPAPLPVPGSNPIDAVPMVTNVRQPLPIESPEMMTTPMPSASYQTLSVVPNAGRTLPEVSGGSPLDTSGATDNGEVVELRAKLRVAQSALRTASKGSTTRQAALDAKQQELDAALAEVEIYRQRAADAEAARDDQHQLALNARRDGKRQDRANRVRLREAQGRVRTLSEELGQLKARFEGDAQARQQLQHDLETELAALRESSKVNADVQTDLDCTRLRVAELETEVATWITNAKDADRSATEWKLKAAEAGEELLAQLDENRDLKAQAQDTETQLASARHQVTALEVAKTEAEQTCALALTDLEQLKAKEATSRAVAERAQADCTKQTCRVQELEQLIAANQSATDQETTALKAQLAQARTDLDAARLTHQQAQAEHATVEQALQATLADLRIEHSQTVAKLDAATVTQLEQQQTIQELLTARDVGNQQLAALEQSAQQALDRETATAASLQTALADKAAAEQRATDLATQQTQLESDRAKLNSQLAEMTEERDHFQTLLTTTGLAQAEQTAHLTASRDQVSAKLAVVTDQLMDVTAQLTDTQANLEEAQAQASAAVQQANAYREHLAVAQAERAAIEDERNQMADALDTANARLAAADAEINHRVEQQQYLAAQLAEHEATIVNLTQQRSDLLGENARLRASVESGTAQTKSVISSLTAARDQAEENLATVTANLNLVTNQLSQAHAGQAETAASLANSDARVVAIEQAYEQLRVQTKAQVSDLTDQLHAAEARAAAANNGADSKLAEHEATIANLTQQRSNLLGENAQLRASIESGTAQTESVISSLTAARDQAEENLAIVTANLNRVTNQLSQAHAGQAETAASLANSDARVVAIEQAYEQLRVQTRAQVSDLTGQLHAAEARAAAANKAADSALAELRITRQQVTESRTDVLGQPELTNDVAVAETPLPEVLSEHHTGGATRRLPRAWFGLAAGIALVGGIGIGAFGSQTLWGTQPTEVAVALPATGVSQETVAALDAVQDAISNAKEASSNAEDAASRAVTAAEEGEYQAAKEAAAIAQAEAETARRAKQQAESDLAKARAGVIHDAGLHLPPEPVAPAPAVTIPPPAPPAIEPPPPVERASQSISATCTENASFTVTAIGNGQVDLSAGGQSASGLGSASVSFEATSMSASATADVEVTVAWTATSAGTCE